SKIRWAHNIHKENNTYLIETFSYQAIEGSIEEHLMVELTKAGIEIKTLSPQEKWAIISESANNEVQGIIKLIGTFINLMKGNSQTPESISCKSKRDQKFIELISPIYNLYQEELKERNEIDFNDMIHLASNCIKNKTYSKRYKHIIIDEYQDISRGRYELINNIKSQQPECKLFCVGDDWQSIYRFSGSDLNLFRNFQQYFGYTVKSKIESTYRFNNPLMSLSSEFIQKNPIQERKELRSKCG
ncbi:UvrD-helicase domain-containing protein, partial [Flavobacteriaceae bacterium]|nr:UvrD-helicase domain-containing protein [Flavobacteriaceae bacterium]